MAKRRRTCWSGGTLRATGIVMERPASASSRASALDRYQSDRKIENLFVLDDGPFSAFIDRPL
ncbi:hypothetical protein ABZV29_13675 [Streptomyces sp. NPDC005236]|uniref:hypothetical protein n=1 Tax=Streptomyces sp. NPDC005236 TaxID=3157028 RepID=UPI0033A7B50F